MEIYVPGGLVTGSFALQQTTPAIDGGSGKVLREEPSFAGTNDLPRVSRRTRRWTKIVLLGLVLAVGGFIALVDVMERRLIDYASAEQIHSELQAGHFRCEEPYFPTGRGEPTNYSTATCRHGLSTVHIAVNQERGHWIGHTNTEPHRSGKEAMVAGSNWSVSFEAPIARSIRLAREVQPIVGGEIVHPLPQEDY